MAGRIGRKLPLPVAGEQVSLVNCDAEVARFTDVQNGIALVASGGIWTAERRRYTDCQSRSGPKTGGRCALTQHIAGLTKTK